MFKITDGKGFHVTFANGWTVSVQFGPGNYADNYSAPIERSEYPIAGQRGSGTAEVAAWNSNDKWHGDVRGYQTPADVLAFMNEVAALPAA